MALLWPERPSAEAKAELRRAISQLRSCMGQSFIEGSGSSLSIGRGTVVDSVEFEGLVREGTRLARLPGEAAAARPLLERAVALYKADFLAGFALADSPAFDDWMLFEAERLRSLLASALDHLSVPIPGPGLAASAEEALPFAQRRLQLDEFDEAAQRRLILLYALSGQRAAALRQFEASRQLLRAELGVEPSKESLALVEKVERNLAMTVDFGALFLLPREDRSGDAVVPTVDEAGTVAHPSPPARRVRLPRAAALLLGGVLVLAAAVGTYSFATSRQRASGTPIAVLPLVTDSEEKGQDWFSDGMTDAIITELARNEGLRVTSHTSVNRYLGARLPVSVIRKELGADYLVEGSVLRSGARLRITTQLIDAKADRHLWAESYEGELGEVLDLQARISGDIAAHVASRLAPAPSPPGQGLKKKVDPMAYEAYLLGAYEISNGDFKGETCKKGLADLALAIRLDPAFAPPHTALANYYWEATQWGLFTNPEGMRLAKAEARKAVDLDPSLSEAHTVLGFVSFLFDCDWKGSEREFRTAIALNPSSSVAHCWYGSMLCSEGRFKEALAEVKLAKDLDPLSSINILNVAMRCYYARYYDEAIKEASVVRDLAPDFYMCHMVIGYAQTAQGRYAEAAATLEKSAELAGDFAMEPLAILAYAYARAGRPEESRKAEDRLTRLTEKGMSVSPLLRAYVPLGRGDLDAAMGLIEEAEAQHDLNLAWNFQDPFFDPLRSTPRFVALRKRLGL
jgi:TolB-like protein/DNA-binding SARP family transcriptional activator/Tfp pilus assembly protein PilF